MGQSDYLISVIKHKNQNTKMRHWKNVFFLIRSNLTMSKRSRLLLQKNPIAKQVVIQKGKN